MEIDYERLRNDLIDYYGTALSYEPLAVIGIIRVDTSTDDELISIANKEKININNYIKSKSKRRVL